MVHYRSLGSADGEFEPQCRAAVITEVVDDDLVGLTVFNPTGLFFHRREQGDKPGQWHWPERVE